ncbi:MAG: ABC transporter ATP-binding protein [Candidatus Riflebacteria bacterium]|nr:ABC transporter ATP-binding protein [Candidatus Riflebacteria bacterium]
MKDIFVPSFLKRHISQIARAVKLVWSFSPKYAWINLGITILQSVLPILSLLLLKFLLDALTQTASIPDKNEAFRTLFFWIILSLLVALINSFVRAVSEVTQQTQSVLVTDGMADLIHSKSISADLEFYENSEFHDTLHRAQREALFRPSRIVANLLLLAQSTFTCLGIVSGFVALNWKLTLLLFLIMIPGFFVKISYAKRLYKLEHTNTNSERLSYYYHSLLTGANSAREIKLLDLGNIFRDKYNSLRRGIREGRILLSKKRAKREFLIQLVGTLAMFGLMVYIIYDAVWGRLTIGSIAMYFQGMQLGQAQLQSVMRALASLYEDNLFLSAFFQFTKLTPSISAPEKSLMVPVSVALNDALKVENVSFRYSGKNVNALSDVSLTLRRGQVIAIVGENGSGKTTLLKLICRLYDPMNGSINFDGTDIRRFDPAEWHRQLSVVFQDYLQYMISVKENIWVGASYKEQALDEIKQAASIAGADKFIQRLPHNYDTVLGRQFIEGSEISGGEWQKIALARMFFRPAQIYILDEPTSALDTISEAKVFSSFREHLQGRSAILVSHRFTTVRQADYIYVLEGGRIVESGDHNALMKNNQLYARLYQAQIMMVPELA